MIQFRRILSVLFISLLFCLLAAPAFPAFLDKVGTRPLGMGGAFVALADESSAFMWNPAGLAQMKQTEIITTYASLYTGLGEDRLGRTYISYTLPLQRARLPALLKDSALGINYIRLQSPLYRENTIAFSFSKKLQFLYLGLNAKGLFANCVENEYTKNDPLFQSNGLLSKGFSVDLGLLLKTGDVFSFGMFARNINQPNMSLDPGAESIEPLELSAGIALRSLKLNPSLGFTFRDNKIRGKRDVNVRFGLETWFFNHDVGLRAGANLYELAAGASCCFKQQDIELQLDYAFRYPMPFQIENDYFPGLAQAHITNTTGSHQFSLSLRFDHFRQLIGVDMKKSEVKLEPALQKALSYQKTGDYETAIAGYKQVLQKDNTNHEAHFLLARLYAKQKRYQEAITHYNRAISLAPNEPRLHYALGCLYEQYGDDTGNRSWYNKAIIEFTKTKMLDEDYDDISSKLNTLEGRVNR